MGGIYHIKRVVVTNRKQGHWTSLSRSTNLCVGVTNTRPVVGESVDLDAYDLCDEKPGYMGPVGIAKCQDDVSGQFVIVQFNVTECMNIAEVRIYGFKDNL